MYYLIIVTRLIIDKYVQITLINEDNRKDIISLTIWATGIREMVYQNIIETLQEMNIDPKSITDPIYIPKENLAIEGTIITMPKLFQFQIEKEMGTPIEFIYNDSNQL